MEHKNQVFEIPKISNLTRVLLSWKLLCIGFIAGGLLGAVFYRVLPPLYRANTVVVINQNLEKLLPDSPDKEIFYFLERETNRLEELAFSDIVLQQVADENPGYTIANLRSKNLVLAQPSDGGWKMYGYADQPAQAKALATTWARIFSDEVERGIFIASRLTVVEDQLYQVGNLNQTQIDALTQEQAELQKQSLGIHPFAQVFLSQQNEITAEPARSIGAYILAGSLTGLLLVITVGALFLREKT